MNTTRESWMALILPPDRYEPIEVCLSDNSVKRGIWTGRQWWAEGQQVLPMGWRPFHCTLNSPSELLSA